MPKYQMKTKLNNTKFYHLLLWILKLKKKAYNISLGLSNLKKEACWYYLTYVFYICFIVYYSWNTCSRTCGDQYVKHHSELTSCKNSKISLYSLSRRENVVTL